MIGETINAPYAEKFTVSNVFSSDMVVQRGEHIRVWGFADASENGHKVSGEFMGMFAEALIENGAWTLTFGARLNACAEQGNSMRIYTDRTAFVFENVLVGDVFMVIGQSNVAYSMAAHRAAVPEAERGGVGYDVPSTPIRLHYNSLMQETGVTRGTEEVCAELRNRETWKRADAAAVQDFSALGYLFAAEYARGDRRTGRGDRDRRKRTADRRLPAQQRGGGDRQRQMVGAEGLLRHVRLQRRCGAVYVQPLYVPV